MTTKVKECFVTKEMLEEYYLSHFYSKKKDGKKYRKETILRWIYNTIAFFLGVAVGKAVQMITSRVMRELLENLETRIVIGFLLGGLVLITYFELAVQLNRLLFPLDEKINREVKCKIEIEKYYGILELQKKLLENNDVRVGITGKYDLTVTYKLQNGIERCTALMLSEEWYAHTVKEDYLDFSWIDESINYILKKHGFEPITPEVIISNALSNSKEGEE